MLFLNTTFWRGEQHSSNFLSILENFGLFFGISRRNVLKVSSPSLSSRQIKKDLYFYFFSMTILFRSWEISIQFLAPFLLLWFHIPRRKVCRAGGLNASMLAAIRNKNVVLTFHALYRIPHWHHVCFESGRLL